MLELEINPETVTYRLAEGNRLTFQHQGQEITLSGEESKSMRIDFQTHHP